MLDTLYVKRHKSLFNAEIQLEPLTVLVGKNGSGKSAICEALKKQNGACLYQFDPNAIAYQASPVEQMSESGLGVAYSLLDILLSDRVKFSDLEVCLTQFLPGIRGISLQRQNLSTVVLRFIDKNSDQIISASNIGGGTLRLVALLTALYQTPTPHLICFENLESGLHPWSLNRVLDLLHIVTTQGLFGVPIQVVLTTHSPLLLDYLKPHQVRLVELDPDGKTQVRRFDSVSQCVRFFAEFR